MTLVEYVHNGEPVEEPTLTELAETANREHREGLEVLATALEHWIRAGDALDAARRKCGFGRWNSWADENLEFDHLQASVYIRIAAYADVLRAASGSFTSMRQAQGLLKELPAVSWHTTPEVEQLARKLHHEDGLSKTAIAERFGVSRHTVLRWCDSHYATRHREQNRRKAAEKRHAIAALRQREREQAIKRAVRKAGAATQEAWLMAERMQDVLAQAHRETEDREARRALSLAGEHYRKMRDEIVRALGVL